MSAYYLAKVEPWDEGVPAIHGPDIYGASPGKPFYYAIPATGERSLVFSAENLPQGLSLAPDSGHITGTTDKEGEHSLLLRVKNRHGRAEKELTLSVQGQLALTPPMGWNSWNAWRRWVDDDKIRAAADGLVNRGLAARGYTYVNIDSCWQGVRGGKYNAIQPNRKFPNMKALADYVHARGLKLGLYSTPWTVPWGCSKEQAGADWGGQGLIGSSSGEPDPDYYPNSIAEGRYVGQNKHEQEDVAQWLEWGVDFLKYDWMPTDPYSIERMGKILRSSSRDIIFSICTEARLTHAETCKTWANMWRGMPDIHDNWPSLARNAFMAEDYFQEDWSPHIGRGNWNDLDMFALGPQFSSSEQSRPNQLTPEEQITHMTAWAIYPSPMILSCDLASMNDLELCLFANEEVIAVNQDRMGKSAIRLHEQMTRKINNDGPRRIRRIWVKPLFTGGFAAALFNLGDQEDELTLDLRQLGFTGSVTVRDLWARRDLDLAREIFCYSVPAHGARLFRIR